MTSQLPRFQCLFLGYQQQKKTKNRAAVTSLRSFLFHDNFKCKRGILDLKWNQYSSNLAASLAGMRESGAMTDVTLVTEDGARFLAHRVVLAAASNFFR